MKNDLPNRRSLRTAILALLALAACRQQTLDPPETYLRNVRIETVTPIGDPVPDVSIVIRENSTSEGKLDTTAVTGPDGAVTLHLNVPALGRFYAFHIQPDDIDIAHLRVCPDTTIVIVLPRQAPPQQPVSQQLCGSNAIAQASNFFVCPESS